MEPLTTGEQMAKALAIADSEGFVRGYEAGHRSITRALRKAVEGKRGSVSAFLVDLADALDDELERTYRES